MPEVSVILPVLNEKDNLLALVPEIHRVLKNTSHDIWIIDDRSQDGTAEALTVLADPLLHHHVRQDAPGYAASIRYGIEKSASASLILMDADFNHRPDYIPVMLRELTRHDIVSCSRFMAGGRMTPLWRNILSRIFNSFIRCVTGTRLSDNLYGFFAVRRETLNRCPLDEIFTGFGDYGLRLLYHLQKNNARILEIPATYSPRLKGKSHTHFPSLFIRYFKATLLLKK